VTTLCIDAIPTIPATTEVTSLRQSEIGTILACGHKFYLQRILGHQWAGSPKSLVGTAFHRGAENIYRSLMIGDRVDWDEAHQWASENLEAAVMLADEETLKLEGEETRETLLERGQETVRQALEYHRVNIYPKIAGLGTPLAVEEKVSFLYRGIEINGTVDLIDADGVLHDHKLTSAYLKKSFPWNYWMQMARYCWFWAYAAGLPLAGVSLDMYSYARLKNKAPDKRYIEGVQFTDTNMERLILLGQQSVDQAIDLLKMGYFPRNAINAFSGLCDFCEFAGDRCLNS
jgi:hypothetical protein